MTRRPSPNPLVRALFGFLGVVSLAVGIIGIPVPLIPTTAPVLLAAFFFSMSSERLHAWLLNHKRFGPAIRDYQEGRGIAMRAKVIAVVMIGITFGFTLTVVVEGLVLRTLLAALAIGVVVFILTRPTRRFDGASV